VSEPLLWIWNGWGILCLIGFVEHQVLHAYVSVVAQHRSYLRRPLAIYLGIPAIVLAFVLAGWKVGLANLLLGPAFGIVGMKLLFRLAK
jgi:hypothetical protein